MLLRGSKQRQCGAGRELSETNIFYETFIFIKLHKSIRGRKPLKVRAHIFVSGRVQGVFFRQQTQELATRLDVNGWVQNTYDERVEAIFEGEKDDVKRLVEFCKKGPPYARVTRVEVAWEKFAGEFKDFRIHY